MIRPDDRCAISPERLRLTSRAGLEHAATCLRTLAHPDRLRIVQLLLQGSFTVAEVAAACGLPHAHASQHLGLMRDRGLLVAARSARTVRYAVAQPALRGIVHCVEANFGVEEVDRESLLPPSESP